MKVQFFTNRSDWEVRERRCPAFPRGLKCIGKHIDLEYGGIGWDLKTPSSDADFILIHAKRKYPILIGGNYSKDEVEWKKYSGRKVLLFDEMFNREWVERKIQNTGATHIIGHYTIDKYNYQKRGFNFDFSKWAVVPHCADTELFKDYGEEKTIDILFSGSVSSRYNFRKRLRQLLEKKLSKLCIVKIVQKRERESQCFLEGYARQINRAKITICTSSNYSYRLARYAEVPLCGSLMAGNVPRCEDTGSLKEMMCVLHPRMSDREITKKLLFYLKDDKLRKKKIDRGMLHTRRNFSQGMYAIRFIKTLEGWNK